MFADNPKRFDASYRMPNWFVQSHTKNPQLADLGLEFRHMNSQKKVLDVVFVCIQRNNTNAMTVPG